jgi:coiled-coil domain-containing protein 55
MSNMGLSYGLNLVKKAPGNRPQPAKRKPLFEDDDDSDGEGKGGEVGVEEIGEIGGLSGRSPASKASRDDLPLQSKGGKPPLKPGTKKGPISMYGDLSSTFSSKKHAETAEDLDTNIYDYDAVYDSLKPKKKVTQEDLERKPKYMSNLLAAAAVRKRDANIAEEKKLAREREAEGEDYADKEKFVTSAYKKQQEENRRLEAEEKLREEHEAKKSKGTGMTSFYKNMLEKGEQKHSEVIKAVEERIKNGPVEEDEEEKQKTEADLAREINEKTDGAIAVNDEGQVVDKRQLLKGGLNIAAKPKTATASSTPHGGSSMSDRSRGSGFVGAGGGKQAMRERQSRMMEAQLEQATKRALEEEEEERQKVERASKSRKTEGDIMSAKERYLARKREAEEAKKRGESNP